ncbi:MAG TPA: cysteine synthase family protein [Streptosporangiaceae bacterium]|nr:cysteine synthase family protein [Streptosporangiaceae bacterium]
MDILDAIGETPIVDLSSLAGAGRVSLLGKWEGVSPGGGIKDRPARRLVTEAERMGLLRPRGVIIEATSGNFGISLAMIGAVRGYRVIIVVDPKVSPSHRRVMEAYGAEIIEVTEPDASGGYFWTRLETANRLAQEIPASFRPDQHFSLMNAAAHFRETGPEILRQLCGQLDYLVVAVSTAGQLRGLGSYMRVHSPGTRVVGVDAVGSGVFGGERHPYLQSGIGLAWPPSNLDVAVVDLMYKVEDSDSFATCRHLARKAGILAGSSSGSVTFVGLHLAQTLPAHQRILCVLSDSGERYLDTLYDAKWAAERGLDCSLSISELRDRALGLKPVPRSDVERAIADNLHTVAPHAPASTAALNSAALLEISACRP